jgi:hypothetical protein
MRHDFPLSVQRFYNPSYIILCIFAYERKDTRHREYYMNSFPVAIGF